MKTTIITTGTVETLAPETAAIRPARFATLYRRHHGAGEEVPAEVHTAAMWAGADSAEAHEALVAELAENVSRLDSMPEGEDCYVLLAGQGDGCDVWARATVEG